MTNGFEVSVPITIKGGKEGEKVGRQIGEKIASQLNKSLKIIGMGEKGKTDIEGLKGFSRGIKGILKPLAVIGAGITAAVALLAKASPYLKGILSIFGRAFMIFFRPFGDFLATLLRPLAILLLKLAVAWMKLTRPIVGAGKEGAEKAPQIPEGFLGEGKLGTAATDIANWALRLGGSIGQIAYELGKGAFELGGKIGQIVYDIGKAAFDLGGKIGQWLYDSVIKPAGDWIYGKLFGLWNWVSDFPGWLWEKITSIWKWAFDFGAWLWGKITGIWEEGKEFNLKNWLITKITDWLNNSFLGSAFLKIFGKGSYQTGTPYVPETGLYQLHRGEQVVPRTRAGNNKSVIFKPTFQINGNITQDIDMDSIVRRAGRMTEMELKQRGII